MQIIPILACEPIRLPSKMLKQFTNERSSTRSRVNNFDAVVDERLLEMMLREMISTIHNELNYLIWCIDDPKSIGFLRIVNSIEIFIDHFEKVLLLRVVGDESRR